MNSSLLLEIGQLTHPGRGRRTNEDAFGAYTPPDPRWQAVKGAIFAVADGVDGHPGGRIASQLAVQAVVSEYYRTPSPYTAESLERAVKLANAYIYRQARRAYGKMITTLTAAVVRGNELVVANVGDSRAYLVRGRGIWRLTRDHTWVAEEVAAGGLTPDEARRHPWRKVITRALGHRPDVKVDILRLMIQPGDTIVLCSDGLSDRVWDSEIWGIVSRSKPKEAARRLVRLANYRGGNDNITVIVIRAKPPTRRPVAHPAYSGPALWEARKPQSSLVPLVQLAGGLAIATLIMMLSIYLLTSAPG